MSQVPFSSTGLADGNADELNIALRRVLQSMPVRLYDADGEGLTGPERDALEEGGLILEEQGGIDPLAEGTVLYAAIIERSLNTKGVAKLLAVSEGRVRQMIADQHFYSFVLDGRRYVPDFQLMGKRLLPNIAPVNAALPRNIHPVSVYQWYHLPSADLVHGEEEFAPLDWLKAGYRIDEVISAAKHL